MEVRRRRRRLIDEKAGIPVEKIGHTHSILFTVRVQIFLPQYWKTETLFCVP